jgi:hypothetical protein
MVLTGTGCEVQLSGWTNELPHFPIPRARWQAGVSVVMAVDGSAEIARNHGARVVNVGEIGYGSALRGAIVAGRGCYVVILGDADDSYYFTDLGPFIERLRAVTIWSSAIAFRAV